jgi:RNA polymerase sigma-70 factor (ECF subfamily)
VLNVLESHGGEVVSEVGEAEPAPVEGDIHAALDRGDARQALLLCAEQYGPAIGRLCMALLGSQSEAEDVAQETLVSAYQSFEAYRRDGSLRAWLCGIARKKCLKALETRRRRAAKLVLIEGGEPAQSAEELLERRQSAERARALLNEVRPTEREALVLRFQCELGYDGVALGCAIDEAAARKRVSRGLLRLRELLAGAKRTTEES